ncbi:class I SAM-dependent methyltransferase [Pelagicoccus sp. SDUM812003]|uniref:SAM-dependent methyltransferase n=1 Tax=Pelagicoccus sp. SDUM812003 TaxID=3041267 RepID=UPI0031F2F101
MWDQRYAQEGYAYGIEPNAFLAENAYRLASPTLSLAEGEGRNAVFLAKQGLRVTGIDSSSVGLGKAQALSEQEGVSIETVVADLSDCDLGKDRYRSLVSIFAHFPSAWRKGLYQRCLAALRPGSIILLEAYTPEQLELGTGGPKDPDLLVTLDSLREDFEGCEILLSRTVKRPVNEGRLHTGLASVAQFIARAPDRG